MPNTDLQQTSSSLSPGTMSSGTKAAATASPAMQPRRRWRLVLVIAGLTVVGGLAAIWAPAQRYAQTGAAYGARVACSCRFIGGRSLADCQKDMEGPVAWASLSDDTASRSVTARYPLLARQTATYREGWGCQLQPWTGPLP
eukprot:gene1587-1614_t